MLAVGIMVFTCAGCGTQNIDTVAPAEDVSTLEETNAGVIMGDAVPNIIFKSVDGELGIAGIN